MDWLSSLFAKEKRIVVHSVLVFILSFVILISGTSVSGFIGNSTVNLFYLPFFKLKEIASRLAVTSKQNQELETAVVEMSTRLQLFNETLEENRRLRSLLGFIPPTSFKIVPVEIIGVYGVGVPNSVLINKGGKDSVRVNQTVINQNGVAGRIAEVLDDYSVVYLLTEPRCRVAARIKRSREQGIIRYNFGSGMIMDNLPRQGDVIVGDTIITSGLGGIFPEGLVIGVVANVSVPERQFFYDIALTPAVNFNGIDELYILAREE